MSRNGSKKSREKASFGSFLSMARFALAEAGFACDKVIRRVLVAVRAMCFCALSCAVSKPAKSKPWLKNTSFFLQYFANRKAAFGSLKNSVRFQTRHFCKRGRNMFSAVNNDFTDASPVQLLLGFASPPAVFWRVRAIVVNAVNCVAVWARPHVLQEIQKPGSRFQPSLANVNAPASVVPIKAAAFNITPALHSCPNRTQWMGFLFSHTRIMSLNGIGSQK